MIPRPSPFFAEKDSGRAPDGSPGMHLWYLPPAVILQSSFLDELAIGLLAQIAPAPLHDVDVDLEVIRPGLDDREGAFFLRPGDERRDNELDAVTPDGELAGLG